MSGGCLDDSRGYDVPALVNIQLDSSLLAASFSLRKFLTVASEWTKSALIWGVCGVSARCLCDVWMVWKSSGILPWVIKLYY